jgi:3-hydroxyisobutyrate dehydrogenase-like beta-hydroxyacid dehydrogenase
MQLQFAIGNAQKDVRYYLQMAEALPSSAFIGAAIHQLFSLANAAGRGQHFVPEVIDVLAALGDKKTGRGN